MFRWQFIKKIIKIKTTLQNGIISITNFEKIRPTEQAYFNLAELLLTADTYKIRYLKLTFHLNQTIYRLRSEFLCSN